MFILINKAKKNLIAQHLLINFALVTYLKSTTTSTIATSWVSLLNTSFWPGCFNLEGRSPSFLWGHVNSAMKKLLLNYAETLSWSIFINRLLSFPSAIFPPALPKVENNPSKINNFVWVIGSCVTQEKQSSCWNFNPLSRAISTQTC